MKDYPAYVKLPEDDLVFSTTKTDGITLVDLCLGSCYYFYHYTYQDNPLVTG